MTNIYLSLSTSVFTCQYLCTIASRSFIRLSRNYTGLFKMIVGVLTTCHKQYTWDWSVCIFLFNRTALQGFVTYLTAALYVHPLWFYKHQHDNRVRSACQRWWFQWRFRFVLSVPGYTRTQSLETVHTTFEWNCQMVVISRIWCGTAPGQLYPDYHFEYPCKISAFTNAFKQQAHKPIIGMLLISKRCSKCAAYVEFTQVNVYFLT